MGNVAHYNIYKAVSTLCTVGSPIVTLASCSSFITKDSETSISAAGMFAILISLLFAKDKLAEKFKAPSAFIVAFIGFVLICIVENLLMPMKAVCIVTMITSGVDELTFKPWYKAIRQLLPEKALSYEHFGFIFTTSKKPEE